MKVSDPVAVLNKLNSDTLGRLGALSLDITGAWLDDLFSLLENTPHLHSLQLSFLGDPNETEIELETALNDLNAYEEDCPVLPKLHYLKVTYPDISRTILDFVEVFSLQLERLDMHVKAYNLDFAVAGAAGGTGFKSAFPALTELTLSGNIDALRGPLASISDDAFPSLQDLRYLPDHNRAYSARRPTEPKINKLSRTVQLERVTAYNRLGPLRQPSPRVGLPRKRKMRVAMPPLYPHLFTHVSNSEASQPLILKRDLRRTLDFLHDWEARADAYNDEASLSRIAVTLSRVELERITHEA
ncbi:hypothetical protein JCM10908_002239 [Rhodotorula pacifica]|uniref:uncharacterized protein n=1 Tax=Rhodotorula pacifica TaxID=1495444 RepID=UPI00317C6E0C